MRTLRLHVWFAAALAAALTHSASLAQDYPTKPIRVIASQGAGGISDIFIRTVGNELQKRWGQPLVVENRPGAANNIAARACVEAAPDGYTICMIPESVFLFNPHLFKKMPLNPATDLTPISHLFSILGVVVANSALKVRTFEELAALSKAKPGTLSYFAPSIAQDIVFDTFKRQTGADLVRVPFRGGGQAVSAILAGTTPIGSLGLGNLIPYLQAGKMVALAIHGEQRSPLVPDVPTLRETGYKGDLLLTSFGLWAPAGTPRPIADRLYREIKEIGAAPGFRDKHLVQRGLAPEFSSPDEYRRWIEAMRPAALRIVKALKVEPQ